MKRRLNSFKRVALGASSLLPSLMGTPTIALKLFTASLSIGLRDPPRKFKEIMVNIELLYPWEALMESSFSNLASGIPDQKT